MLRQRHVDGLTSSVTTGKTPSITTLANIPCVYVYGPTNNRRDVVHVVDDFAGGATIANHLVGLGRQRIAHITGPKHAPAVQQTRPRGRSRSDEHGLHLLGGVRYGRWCASGGHVK